MARVVQDSHRILVVLCLLVLLGDLSVLEHFLQIRCKAPVVPVVLAVQDVQAFQGLQKSP